MHLKISTGTDNFKKLVTESDVFVDKSLFIKEIIDSGEEAILITRPRRWGKSLALDMLKTFLEPENKQCPKATYKDSWLPNIFRSTPFTEPVDKDHVKKLCNKNIFSNLKISTVDSGKYMNYQGKYPVILVSLKDVTGQTVEEIKSSLALLMSELFSQYEYVYKEIRDKTEKTSTDIDNLNKINSIINRDAKVEILRSSLKFLSKLLYDYYQQKVYILVDEYDKPVNSLLEKRLSEDYDQIIKNISLEITTLLSAAGKTNNYLEKIILTGIFDTVKKEGGSGFTNLSVYGITDPNFSQSFGFTRTEVDELVSKFTLTNANTVLKNIATWYNGYSIPITYTQNIEVYTPWAVMKHLSEINKYGEDSNPKSYWVTSGASTMLQALLKNDACVNSTFSISLLNITEASQITLTYDPAISLLKYELATAPTDERVFSYLLLNTGYLNSVQSNYTHITLSIPNLEVRTEFYNVLKTHILKVQQETPNICTKIVDALHYKQHILAVDKIHEGNTTEIEHFFSSRPNQPCYDKGLSTNYQELAIMFHKPDHDLHTILDKHCSISTRSYKNGENLKLTDYRYIFYPNHQNVSELSITKPSMIQSVVCYKHIIPAISAITGGLLGKLVEKILPTREWIPTILGSFLGYMVPEDITKDYFCEAYQKYSEIDISRPEELKTLIQFEKYILEYPGTYLTTGECQENRKPLTSTSFSLFPNHITENELKLSLCGTAETNSGSDF